MDYEPPLDLSCTTVAFGLARLLGVYGSVADISSNNSLISYIVADSKPSELPPAKRQRIARVDKEYNQRTFQIELFRDGIEVTQDTLDNAIAEILVGAFKESFVVALRRRQS